MMFRWNLISGRTPHGVRGLKSLTKRKSVVPEKSHPSRGAWIEMGTTKQQDAKGTVAPLTGCVD